MIKNLLIAIFLSVSLGCAAVPMSPPLDITPPPHDPIPAYALDISELSLPPRPVPIYLDTEYQVTDKDSAAYAAYSGPELAKIVAAIKLAKKERDIIEGQVELINTYIDQSNNWQNVAALKGDQAQEFYQLYREAQNQYQTEKHEHRMDNLMNRIMWYLIPIAGIALAAGG